MKIALVHDWIDAYGGAERVLTAIVEKYEFDYYYTYVNLLTPEVQRAVFAGNEIELIESNLLSPFKPLFRYFMPFFPFIVSRFNRQTKDNKVDLVICSSWALSKGYRIGNEINVTYLQARNFKYVWDEADSYFKGFRKVLSFLKPYLRRYDIKSAQNPQYLIANSEFVREWARAKYNRDSVVIYPPVEVEDLGISDDKGDYYITIGRLEPYKRFDIVIDAFNKNGKKLIVIGSGSQQSKLQNMAKSNITFLGYMHKKEFQPYLSQAKAFVYAGVEDFGIALVEALACGTPVIAYADGASKELIEHLYTGYIYDSQTPDTLVDAIEKFENIDSILSPQQIRNTSLKFSKKRFQEEFTNFIESVTPKSKMELASQHYEI